MEITENKYYNYILLDPRKPYKWLYKKIEFDYLPFYVGKGSGNRVRSHYSDSDKDNKYKYNVIQKLKQGGYLPTYSIIYENSTEKQAFKEEIELILCIKTNIPEANLTNICPGGENPPVHMGGSNINATKVYLYDSHTGIFIKEWDCAADACRFLNISTEMSKHINQCCKGTRRTAAGYIWKYDKVDNVEPEIGKKFSRFVFDKLIAYNDSEYHEFNSMKEAYEFLGVPNKGKINQVLKNQKHTYKGYYWDIILINKYDN